MGESAEDDSPFPLGQGGGGGCRPSWVVDRRLSRLPDCAQRNLMFSLQNKITLVTGARSGIGAAIAEGFAHAGAHVFATDRDAPSGRESLAGNSTDQRSAEVLRLDL